MLIYIMETRSTPTGEWVPQFTVPPMRDSHAAHIVASYYARSLPGYQWRARPYSPNDGDTPIVEGGTNG